MTNGQGSSPVGSMFQGSRWLEASDTGVVMVSARPRASGRSTSAGCVLE